ncbi:MAG TPA: hypothetical protein VGD80_32410 [Kofleriaceae bacterium]
MTPTRQDERIEIRVSGDALAEWRAAADDERMTLAEWIRRQCYQAIANRMLAQMMVSGKIDPTDPLVEGSIRPGSASSRTLITDAILKHARENDENEDPSRGAREEQGDQERQQVMSDDVTPCVACQREPGACSLPGGPDNRGAINPVLALRLGARRDARRSFDHDLLVPARRHLPGDVEHRRAERGQLS